MALAWLGGMTPRRFPGQRLVRVLMRTVHLGAVAVVLGGAIYGADLTQGLEILLISGMALAAEEVWRHGLGWFRFVQAWVVLTKLALFGIVLTIDAMQVPALWAALVLGALISHASGAVRQRALWGAPGPCASK